MKDISRGPAAEAKYTQSMSQTVKEKLRQRLKTAAVGVGVSDEETVPDCKLADLRLGGRCVQTDAPCPETPLVDLCVKANELEVHTDSCVGAASVFSDKNGLAIVTLTTNDRRLATSGQSLPWQVV